MPTTSPLGLLIPAFICVVLLVVHSYVFRGGRITLFFFSFLYIFHAIRGFSDLHAEHRDYVPLLKSSLTYKGLSVGGYLFVIPIGWIFAYYTSWCIAEAVLRDDPKKRDAFFPMVALSAFGMGLIGVCIEKANEAFLWWRWTELSNIPVLQYFFVWVLWAIMIFNFLFMFYIKGPKKWLIRSAIIVYLLLFMALVVYSHLSQGGKFIFLLMAASQIPLYYINAVKLRPMRKEDVKVADS